MTPNIGKLYTIGNHFSSWVWIQDCYLKIRLLCLAQIYFQSFCLYENTCQLSGHFRRKMRTPLWRGDCVGYKTALDPCEKRSEEADPSPRNIGLPHATSPAKRRRLGLWQAGARGFGPLWRPACEVERWWHCGFMVKPWGRVGGRRESSWEDSEGRKEKEKGKTKVRGLCVILWVGAFSTFKNLKFGPNFFKIPQWPSLSF